MSDGLYIAKASVFKTVGTVKEDVTAYGNRFYLQFEDDQNVDHRELRQFKDKIRKVTIIINELENEGDNK